MLSDFPGKIKWKFVNDKHRNLIDTFQPDCAMREGVHQPLHGESDVILQHLLWKQLREQQTTTENFIFQAVGFFN